MRNWTKVSWAVVLCALWAREAGAAGPKSNGSTVVVDDLPTGSAGSVGLSGSGITVDGTLGQVAAQEENNGGTSGTDVENGYLSKEVSSPTFVSIFKTYATSAAFTWANGNPSNPLATLYHVDVATTSAFTTILASSDTFLFSSTITNLSGNTTYYARVMASYMQGDDSIFTSLGTTTTFAADPINGALDQTGPYSLLTAWNTQGNPGGDDVPAWTVSGNSLPTAVQALAMAFSNGNLYVSGGFDGTNPRTDVSVAPINSNGGVGPWTSIAPLPAPRESHAMAAWNGRLYVAGGFDNAPQSTVWFAPINQDGSLGAWQTVTPMPAARYKHTLSADSGYLYVIGGENSIGPQSTVWSAKINDDGSIGPWSATTSLPAVRSGHAVSFSSGQVYVSGGIDSVVQPTVYWATVSNGAIVGGNWYTTTPLPAGRFRHAMSATRSRIYVTGGDDGISVQSTVYVATVTPGAGLGPWFMASSNLPAVRYLHSMVLRGNQLYVAGGSDGSSVQSSVWTVALGGTQYNVEKAGDVNFTTLYSSTNWQPGTLIEFSGLTPNTTYFARVTARSFSGVPSQTLLAGTTVTAAAQPLSAASTFTMVGVSSIAAQWTANGNPGNTPYQLSASTAPDFSGTLFASGFSTGLSTAVAGLAPNTSYYFRAQAENSNNRVSPFTALGATFTLTAAPTGSTVTNAGFTNFSVSWFPNGNPAGTLYEAQLSTSASFTPLQPSSFTLTTSVTFYNLQSATTFYSRVRGINANGIPGAFDVVVTTVTGADMIPPGVSTGAAAYQSGSSDSVVATWIAPGDDNYIGNLTPGSQFLVQWSTMDPSIVAWSTSAAQVVVATGPVTQGAFAGVVIGGLPDRKTVYFREWTKDAAGLYSAPSSTFNAFSSSFGFETPDPTAGEGLGATLAVDKDGNLHAVYVDVANGNHPVYVKRTSGVWGAKHTIDSSASLATSSTSVSLALDTLGNPYVAYRDDSATSLKFASSTNGGTSWNLATVDGGGNRGTYSSIAVDGALNVHIAYRDETAQALRYAKYAGGAWTLKVIDGAGGAGLFNSIALDGAGNAFIAYGAASTPARLLAKTTDYGLDFTTQTVDSVGNPAYSLQSALALDPNGNPALAYVDLANNAVKFASYTASGWAFTTLDQPGGLYAVSLALDGTGYPLISYAARAAGVSDNLKFANFNGVSWSTQTVDSYGSPGSGAIHACVAADNNGDVHAAYAFAQTPGQPVFKVAHWTGAALGPPMGGNARGRAQAPYNFAGVSASTISIQWSWTDNSSNELGFRLYGAATSTGPFALIAGTATIAASPGTGATVSFIESGLTINTTYFRYIAAVNPGGVAVSSPAMAYPLFTVDTVTPTITNNQLGDNTWRRINNGLYNVTFSDVGGSHLSKFQVLASSVTGGAPPGLTGGFVDVVTNINADSYTTPWGLPASVFTSMLESATNYVSVRVFDGAGNSTTTVDAFYVLKDTTPPVIVDNQPGDNTPRNAPGTTYNVSVRDTRSGLSHFQYSASTTAGSADGNRVGWTDIASVTNTTYYATPWQVNFTALSSLATNYVSVRAWDVAGTTSTTVDAFYVLKTTGGPTVGLLAPTAPYYSSLPTISGTAQQGGVAPLQGIEVNMQQTSIGLYWNGSGFVSASPVWFAIAASTNWAISPGIPWADGLQYQVVARASDTANNYSTIYATGTFTFDASTPTVAVTSPTTGSTIGNLALISGTSKDPGSAASGVAYVEVRLQRNTDGQWWNWATNAWSSVAISSVATSTNPWTLTTPPLLQANLQSGTSYFIAVRASDNATPQNQSSFAVGGATFTFLDTVPPGAVTNLSALSGPSPGQISLSWTAPGDNGYSGIILLGQYRIQFSTISGTAFSTASAQVAFATGTVIPGSSQGRTLSTTDGLLAGATYFLRIWTQDTAGNWSALSNGATAQAMPPPSNSILGHVMKVSSEGITAVEVDAYDASNNLAATTFTLADGSGTFALTGLNPGLYRVQAAWTSNGVTSSVSQDNIAMGTVGLDFILNLNYTLSTLTGLLQYFGGGTTTSGFGVRAAANNFSTSKVELWQNNKNVAVAYINPTGRWTIAHLLPGKYGVRAFDGLEYTDMQWIDLLEGETKDVGFVFDPLPADMVFAFPNPAKDNVTIRFVTALFNLEAQVDIFDITGALVREIPGSQIQSPSPALYHALWDLKNSRGENVASGVYLFMVKVKGGLNQTAKVIKKVAVVR